MKLVLGVREIRSEWAKDENGVTWYKSKGRGSYEVEGCPEIFGTLERNRWLRVEDRESVVRYMEALI